MQRPENTLEAFERAVVQHGDDPYHLRLYITGATPRSSRAIANTHSICDTYLAGRYELEVVDVYQQAPAAAAKRKASGWGSM